ncbi:hypothetical protein BcepIL02_gp31 [Burkholderia phage BcepIL02]|uniref:Uncharacterized protein n=1 Tax=Burkholderia phage BcepIL02 TaxID=2886898 RepID=C5IHM3_9CAUD|nr:hypothetical protein BcepIL02_gp31 [Burkholderia phage BcepIL02]ACR15024.1 hypothetical protein BcepIL02_gp31 [Burkholderia phage BcepIL02]
MTIIFCPACDWSGHTYSVSEITVDAMRKLKPGQPVPHGHCPECNALIPFENQTDKDALHWRDARPERSNLTQFQRNCLLVALARLDPNHPGFSASNEIEVALRSTIGSAIPIPDDRAPPFNSLTMAPYMDSWVYPLLVGALYGEIYPGQRQYVDGDAAQVRSAMKAAQAKAAS